MQQRMGQTEKGLELEFKSTRSSTRRIWKVDHEYPRSSVVNYMFSQKIKFSAKLYGNQLWPGA